MESEVKLPKGRRREERKGKERDEKKTEKNGK